MVYSENEILQYIEENDVKFVKLTFCDLHGRLKNISILSSELAVTFERGVRIAAKKISGFEAANGRDLYLFPDAQTMTVLPWRPQQGRVIRMFCYIRYKDGTHFEGDSRYFLKKAMKAAVAAGYCFRFGTSCEFTLFHLNDNGLPTKNPAPDDKGENIRRDVCLTLEQMGIQPVSSRHESGCGQHEIDFNSSSALKAADTFLSFKSAVKSVAETHGVHASFMPKPLRSDCGNGMHISFTVFPDSDFLEEHGSECGDIVKSAAAGIMEHIRDFTLLTNSTVNSYARLGEFTAPRDMTLATLPIGYADGYIRAYKNGYAVINGKKAPIVGRICMDQLMVDVTDIPSVSCGDEALMMGGSGISADELAAAANTINYEVTCLISKRVGRVLV